MRARFTRAGLLATLGLLLTACSAPPGGTPSLASASPTPAAEPAERQVAGTVVTFTAGSVVVKAVIEEDTPTTRSFLAMLPMTLSFSDFGGREKVASPPTKFDFTDAAGMTPRAGDLFSYKPWSNLGFFYNADGLTHDDNLVRIGTTVDLDSIERLEGQQVTIAIAG